MQSTKLIIRLIVSIFLLSLSVSCTGLHLTEKGADTTLQYVSVTQDGTLLAKYAPVFILEDTVRSYNRMGTPAARDNGRGVPEVYIDQRRSTIYSMEQKFKTKNGEYTNLTYRIHFERIPFKHLTAGKNVGLLVIVTVDQNDKPLLLTTVHTCGCYLAIIPTSNLSEKSYPENWPLSGQNIYGERLPGIIGVKQPDNAQDKFVLRIRGETHRVMHVDLLPENAITSHSDFVTALLKPMDDLRKLPFGDTEISFFETKGPRKGYVRNSHKPFERLLMSWWSMDWRIGEDKDLGPSEETGTTFYTSLKFWAWKKSDLWNFANFLEYWGWTF
ncbi:MAG: hypothetical protein J7K90_06540 [Desulfuromusa sp.]|nr:hypothetical protein [Desulfuromusa sp.]